MAEERWVLMSEETYDAVRFGVGTPDLTSRAVHTMAETIEVDEQVHAHLNVGGVVYIHCPIEGDDDDG